MALSSQFSLNLRLDLFVRWSCANDPLQKHFLSRSCFDSPPIGRSPLTVGDDLILNNGGILNVDAGSIVTVPATGELTINPGGQINIGSATSTGTLNTGSLVYNGVFSFLGGALGIASGG
jgi:hypothetical protein